MAYPSEFLIPSLPYLKELIDAGLHPIASDALEFSIKARSYTAIVKRDVLERVMSSLSPVIKTEFISDSEFILSSIVANLGRQVAQRDSRSRPSAAMIALDQ